MPLFCKISALHEPKYHIIVIKKYDCYHVFKRYKQAVYIVKNKMSYK